MPGILDIQCDKCPELKRESGMRRDEGVSSGNNNVSSEMRKKMRALTL